MKLPQNDPRITVTIDHEGEGLVNPIHRWGCLFRSLGGVIEDHLRTRATAEEITEAYYFLVGMAKDRGEYHGMREDCFVQNHEDVLRVMYNIMHPFHHVDVEYLCKLGFDGSGSSEFGEPGEFTNVLFQVETLKGNGHFRQPEWDPYPGSGVKRVRSLRFYKVED